MSLWRKVMWVGIYAFLVFTILLIMGNGWVIISTQKAVFTDYAKLPTNPVGLVLGTSNRLSDGSPNPFFDNRMQVAADLYKLGKVSHIIVSGDNRTRFYNEPLMMKRALVNLGVPDSAITLDYAGLRTLDSVIRSKEIFGQDHITIITQPFHSYRAIFISHYYHIDAVAMVVRELPQDTSVKIYIREYFARAKAILDLYILKTSPRHMGDKEPIAI